MSDEEQKNEQRFEESKFTQEDLLEELHNIKDFLVQQNICIAEMKKLFETTYKDDAQRLLDAYKAEIAILPDADEVKLGVLDLLGEFGISVN